MTTRLILIRHAKSSWDDAVSGDHARPLNQRGRHDAPVIGRWLAAKGYVPQVLLCSDAKRTRQTAALIMPALPEQPELILMPHLYHAAPQTIADAVAQHSETVIGVVGHNPGIGMLANRLVDSPPDHPRFADFPTCAVAVIDLTQGASLPQSGRCVDFIVPRDLTEAP